MAENIVNASIVINFQSILDNDQNGLLSLEVLGEDQPDGDTTFYFGDSPVFRQYKTPSVSVQERIISDNRAAVSAAGSGVVEVEKEIVTFANSNKATTRYPIKDGTLSVVPVGGTIGNSFAKTGPTEIMATNPANKDRPIGVCMVSYRSDYTKWRLSGVQPPTGWPAGEQYPVLVYVFGTVNQ